MTQPTNSDFDQPPKDDTIDLGDDVGWITLVIAGKTFKISPLEVIESIAKLTPNKEDQNGIRFTLIVQGYVKNKFGVDVSLHMAWAFYEKVADKAGELDRFFIKRFGLHSTAQTSIPEPSDETPASDSTEPSTASEPTSP